MHDASSLRRSLQIDGVASGLCGVLLLAGAGQEQDVVLNAAWVAGSAVVILAGPLTALGTLAVAAVAVAVLLFGILEAVGLARLRQAVR